MLFKQSAETGNFSLELRHFLSQTVQLLILLLAIAGACGVHAFLDAALGDEAILQRFQEIVEHIDDLVAESNTKIRILK